MSYPDKLKPQELINAVLSIQLNDVSMSELAKDSANDLITPALINVLSTSALLNDYDAMALYKSLVTMCLLDQDYYMLITSKAPASDI